MLFRNRSFIEVYDNVLSSHECNLLINYFENSPTISGMCLRDKKSICDSNIKKSIEIENCFFSNKNLVSKIIFPKLMSHLKKYKTKYQSLMHTSTIGVEDLYSYKKFESEDDGFKVWHTEHGCSDVSSRRVLVWTFYVNDAKSGTEFFHYPTVKAKRGRCVIWPAGFTHVHRSKKNKGLKYIISGWASHM